MDLRNLEQIGSGTERNAYKFHNHILKVSRVGRRQHNNEVKMLSYLRKLGYEHIAPKMIRHTDNYIVVEYVEKQLYNRVPKSEVYDYIGITDDMSLSEIKMEFLDHFYKLIETYGNDNMTEGFDFDEVHQISNLLFSLYSYDIELGERFLIDSIKASHEVSQLENKGVLLIQDMIIDNFRIGSDGHIKIVDLGLPYTDDKQMRSWWD